jgi:(R)-2-hydroxyacyl-CoA dehydratese activating ATPase
MMLFLKRLERLKMALFAGVDSGSTSTKAVLLDEGGIIVGTHIVPSGNNLRKSTEVVLRTVMEKTHSGLDDLAAMVTTGYGRFITGLNSKAMSEITCCGRGARYLHSGARTVIDIGGQDSKAIKIDGAGKVVQFSLNDKCAAGTGRFLERIAVSLELTLEKMADLSVHSQKKLPISSTCTVFAETEVISRISNGEPVEGIVKGLHSALGSRIYTLAVGLNIEKDIFICGGGAKNAGLVKELEELFGGATLPSGIDPRLVPAIGAALIARGL